MMPRAVDQRRDSPVFDKLTTPAGRALQGWKIIQQDSYQGKQYDEIYEQGWRGMGVTLAGHHVQ